VIPFTYADNAEEVLSKWVESLGIAAPRQAGVYGQAHNSLSMAAEKDGTANRSDEAARAVTEELAALRAIIEAPSRVARLLARMPVRWHARCLSARQ
jgi:hypothetical protein